MAIRTCLVPVADREAAPTPSTEGLPKTRSSGLGSATGIGGASCRKRTMVLDDASPVGEHQLASQDEYGLALQLHAGAAQRAPEVAPPGRDLSGAE